jgi:uncharacterized protein (TIGR00369 family)
MERYDNCFVCGQDNPIGLRLDFNYQQEFAEARFKLSKVYEGYDGIIHGGIVASILDEAMAKIILHQEIKAVTSALTIGYKKPLKPDENYTVQGTIISIRRRIVEAESRIFKDEELYARAEAKFFILK